MIGAVGRVNAQEQPEMTGINHVPDPQESADPCRAREACDLYGRVARQVKQVVNEANQAEARGVNGRAGSVPDVFERLSAVIDKEEDIRAGKHFAVRKR